MFFANGTRLEEIGAKNKNTFRELENFNDTMAASADCHCGFSVQEIKWGAISMLLY